MRKRFIDKLALLLLLIFFFPFECHAFKYDIWESGISITSAKAIAKKNGIRMTARRHGLYSKDKEYIASNGLSYTSSLFNHKAKVSLIFTNSPELLYKVTTTWEGLSKSKSKELNAEILSFLKQKYGPFRRSKYKSSMYHKGEKCVGQYIYHSAVEGGDDISLSLGECFNLLSLTYTNNSLKQIHEYESVKGIKTNNSADAQKL